MNYSFEYIDIILLAMIAGFIFLRLRGILGKKTGFEGKASTQFEKVLNNIQTEKKVTIRENFDEEAQREFLKGAKIAYETIITDFSDNDNKLTTSKPLLSKKIFDQFNNALADISSFILLIYYFKIVFKLIIAISWPYQRCCMKLLKKSKLIC